MSGLRVAAVVVGARRDGGFNETALAGLDDAAATPGVTAEDVFGTPYDVGAMAAALDAAAGRVGRGGLVVFIGGQGDRVAPDVADHWTDRRFAVIQGSVVGPNLSSYHVLQEESAFLAGVLAASVTRTGVVAHLSGHRVAPGLRGRAAFAAGARHAEPGVGLLTGFCGAQDDVETAQNWATAQLAAGADVLFTMLNAGRAGAIEACRAAGAAQIGNARDWVAFDPAVFIGSALARIDRAVRRAVADAAADAPMGRTVSLGLRDAGEGPPVVSLSIRGDVDAEARARVAAAEAALRAGEIAAPQTYAGPEFAPERVAP